jgi:hypothetical protein
MTVDELGASAPAAPTEDSASVGSLDDITAANDSIMAAWEEEAAGLERSDSLKKRARDLRHSLSASASSPFSTGASLAGFGRGSARRSSMGGSLLSAPISLSFDSSSEEEEEDEEEEEAGENDETKDATVKGMTDGSIVAYESERDDTAIALAASLSTTRDHSTASEADEDIVDPELPTPVRGSVPAASAKRARRDSVVLMAARRRVQRHAQLDIADDAEADADADAPSVDATTANDETRVMAHLPVPEEESGLVALGSSAVTALDCTANTTAAAAVDSTALPGLETTLVPAAWARGPSEESLAYLASSPNAQPAAFSPSLLSHSLAQSTGPVVSAAADLTHTNTTAEAGNSLSSSGLARALGASLDDEHDQSSTRMASVVADITASTGLVVEASGMGTSTVASPGAPMLSEQASDATAHASGLAAALDRDDSDVMADSFVPMDTENDMVSAEMTVHGSPKAATPLVPAEAPVQPATAASSRSTRSSGLLGKHARSPVASPVAAPTDTAAATATGAPSGESQRSRKRTKLGATASPVEEPAVVATMPVQFTALSAAAPVAVKSRSPQPQTASSKLSALVRNRRATIGVFAGAGQMPLLPPAMTMQQQQQQQQLLAAATQQHQSAPTTEDDAAVLAASTSSSVNLANRTASSAAMAELFGDDDSSLSLGASGIDAFVANALAPKPAKPQPPKPTAKAAPLPKPASVAVPAPVQLTQAVGQGLSVDDLTGSLTTQALPRVSHARGNVRGDGGVALGLSSLSAIPDDGGRMHLAASAVSPGYLLKASRARQRMSMAPEPSFAMSLDSSVDGNTSVDGDTASAFPSLRMSAATEGLPASTHAFVGYQPSRGAAGGMVDDLDMSLGEDVTVTLEGSLAQVVRLHQKRQPRAASSQLPEHGARAVQNVPSGAMTLAPATMEGLDASDIGDSTVVLAPSLRNLLTMESKSAPAAIAGPVPLPSLASHSQMASAAPLPMLTAVRPVPAPVVAPVSRMAVEAMDASDAADMDMDMGDMTRPLGSLADLLRENWNGAAESALTKDMVAVPEAGIEDDAPDTAGSIVVLKSKSRISDAASGAAVATEQPMQQQSTHGVEAPQPSMRRRSLSMAAVAMARTREFAEAPTPAPSTRAAMATPAPTSGVAAAVLANSALRIPKSTPPAAFSMPDLPTLDAGVLSAPLPLPVPESGPALSSAAGPVSAVVAKLDGVLRRMRGDVATGFGGAMDLDALLEKTPRRALIEAAVSRSVRKDLEAALPSLQPSIVPMDSALLQRASADHDVTMATHDQENGNESRAYLYDTTSTRSWSTGVTVSIDFADEAVAVPVMANAMAIFDDFCATAGLRFLASMGDKPEAEETAEDGTALAGTTQEDTAEDEIDDDGDALAPLVGVPESYAVGPSHMQKPNRKSSIAAGKRRKSSVAAFARMVSSSVAGDVSEAPASSIRQPLRFHGQLQAKKAPSVQAVAARIAAEACLLPERETMRWACQSMAEAVTGNQQAMLVDVSRFIASQLGRRMLLETSSGIQALPASASDCRGVMFRAVHSAAAVLRDHALGLDAAAGMADDAKAEAAIREADHLLQNLALLSQCLQAQGRLQYYEWRRHTLSNLRTTLESNAAALQSEAVALTAEASELDRELEVAQQRLLAEQARREESAALQRAAATVAEVSSHAAEVVAEAVDAQASVSVLRSRMEAAAARVSAAGKTVANLQTGVGAMRRAALLAVTEERTRKAEGLPDTDRERAVAAASTAFAEYTRLSQAMGVEVVSITPSADSPASAIVLLRSAHADGSAHDFVVEAGSAARPVLLNVTHLPAGGSAQAALPWARSLGGGLSDFYSAAIKGVYASLLSFAPSPLHVRLRAARAAMDNVTALCNAVASLRTKGEPIRLAPFASQMAESAWCVALDASMPVHGIKFRVCLDVTATFSAESADAFAASLDRLPVEVRWVCGGALPKDAMGPKDVKRTMEAAIAAGLPRGVTAESTNSVSSRILAVLSSATACFAQLSAAE